MIMWKVPDRETDTLLITSNFSFPHRVFTRLVLQTCKNKGLFGKDLHIHLAKTPDCWVRVNSLSPDKTLDL